MNSRSYFQKQRPPLLPADALPKLLLTTIQKWIPRILHSSSGLPLPPAKLQPSLPHNEAQVSPTRGSERGQTGWQLGGAVAHHQSSSTCWAVAGWAGSPKVRRENSAQIEVSSWGRRGNAADGEEAVLETDRPAASQRQYNI